MTLLILPNGINLGCRLIDVSLSGAALATDQRPAMGALVTIGKVQGRSIASDNGISNRVAPVIWPVAATNGVRSLKRRL